MWKTLLEGGSLNKVDSKNLGKTLLLKRRDLTKWNKTSFGKIETLIQNTNNNIENLRYLNPNVNTITKEIKLKKKKLEEFLCREDELWRQKFRELYMVKRGGQKY